MKKTTLTLFLAILSMASFFSLGALSTAAPIQVGLVLDKGGKDDKSFNAAAFAGVQEAEKKLGIKAKVVEATDDNAFETLLRSFARKNFDLIIGIGISQAEAIGKVAKQFPNLHFAVVDAEVPAPNVKSLLFQEHEGSYLVGAIAALKSKTGKVGFIGGMDIPLIRRFQVGFEEGAKKINPNVKIVSNYVGVTSDAWNNPPKAKELAVAQYNGGADVIFGPAGASNLGLFDAAEEVKKYAIGVDSNQNWIKPGYVLTSMLKRVDVAVFEACEEASKAKFKAGVKRFGLDNKGIDFALDKFNQALLSSADLKTVNQLKADILAGKIHVTDYYQSKAKK